MQYSNYIILGFTSMCLAVAVEATAANSIAANHAESIGQAKPILLAKAKKRSKRRGNPTPAARERNIIREKTYRGEQRKLDFEAVDIRGERDNPLGTQLGQTRASKEFDLIKIRLRWHPEMIQSTSSLETGRAR